MGEYLFIGIAILSFVNGAVILSLNPRRAVNIAFLVSSFWVVLWASCVALAIHEGAAANHNPHRLILYLRLSSAVAIFLGWSAWLTRTALLYEGAPAFELFKRSSPFLLICSIEAGLAMTKWYIPSDSSRTNHLRGNGYVIFNVVAVAACIWMLLDANRNLKRLRGIRRIEMQFFVLCLIGACLLLLVSNITAVVQSAGWLTKTTPIWFLALHVSAVWALSYYRVFDAKQMIVSAAQRIALFAILTALAVGLSSILDPLLGPRFAMFVSTMTSCMLAILCDGPTRRFLRMDREQLLAKPRSVIIEWARGYPEQDRLELRFEALLREWCQAEAVRLLPAQGTGYLGSELSIPGDWSGLAVISREGWITPEALQRKRTSPGTHECVEFMKRHNFGAILSVPKSSASPSLIVVFGQKHSLRPYTFPDIQSLLELVELMDNILTHSRVAAHATRIEKMESAALMSRGLAHDLNNLATPVSSFLVHMEHQVQPGTPEAIVLADAKHSIGVMRDYIRESLFFSRSLIPKYEQIEAGELLSSVVRSSHARARNSQIHVVIVSADNFPFTVDPALIHRLLQNLVFNAIDASGPASRVELSASLSENQAIFKVTDHGSGLEPHIMDRIFEPYFTTKSTGRDQRGLGLGLAICQKIAGVHDGKITVSCDAESGTLFTCVLPVRPLHHDAPSRETRIIRERLYGAQPSNPSRHTDDLEVRESRS